MKSNWMKFALVLCVLLVSVAQAQTAKVGVLAGLNLANVSVEDMDDDNFDTRSGLAMGVFLHASMSPYLAFQPELVYASKGFKSQGFNGDVTSKLNYIDINLLGKVIVPTQAPIRPTLLAGPYAGILVKGEWEDEDGNTEDIEDVKSMDFGLIIGGGIDVSLVQNMLSLMVRYEIGLANISDAEGEPDVKNKVLSLVAGFTF